MPKADTLMQYQRPPINHIVLVYTKYVIIPIYIESLIPWVRKFTHKWVSNEILKKFEKRTLKTKWKIISALRSDQTFWYTFSHPEAGP